MGVIERGIVQSSNESGYVIASQDREGIITPPLKDVNDKEYTIGDMVYFFYFPDGTGKILCKV